MKTGQLRLFILTVFIGGGLVIGLGSFKKADSGKKEVDLVVTGVGFNPIFYPLENEKVSQPENVQVNLKTADYTQAELFTLASFDQPLVGILSSVNVGKAYNHGEVFKVLAPYYREPVGPDGRSVGQLIVKKTSSVKKAEDLYGKKVGIQGETDGSTIALKTVLRNKYGLDLSKIDFAAYDSELMPELLAQEELDAVMFDSDYILASDFGENFRTLVDFGVGMEELYGVVPPVKFFVVKKELYDADPARYEAAVEFFRKNYEWSQEHMEEIVRLEAEDTGEDFDILLKAADYQSRLDELTLEDVRAMGAFYETAKEEGIIEKIPDLNTLFGMSVSDE